MVMNMNLCNNMTTTDYLNLLFRVELVLDRLNDGDESTEAVRNEVREMSEKLRAYLNFTDLFDTGIGTAIDGWIVRDEGEDMSGDVRFFLYEPTHHLGYWRDGFGNFLIVPEHYGNFKELTFENSPQKAKMFIKKEIERP